MPGTDSLSRRRIIQCKEQHLVLFHQIIGSDGDRDGLWILVLDETNGFSLDRDSCVIVTGSCSAICGRYLCWN